MRAGLVALFAMVIAGSVHAACPPILDHRFTTLQGQELNLCDYQNHVILVVNTASKCGYTPQFEKLESLYRQYRSRGLLVIGFPSNDFNQELVSDKEIASFCKLTYAVDFPMVSKGSVVGEKANPFHKQLAAATHASPRWNFHKYLILPKAQGVYSFSSQIEPDSALIMDKLTPHLR